MPAEAASARHLVELRRVAGDATQIRVYGECYLDVFRHGVGQNFDDLLDQMRRLQ